MIQGAISPHKGKTSKMGLSSLEDSKSETCLLDTQESAQTFPTDNFWIQGGWSSENGIMVGVSMNGMITGVRLDGTKIGTNV